MTYNINATERKAPVYDGFDKEAITGMLYSLIREKQETSADVFRESTMKAMNTAMHVREADRNGCGWQNPDHVPSPRDWKRVYISTNDYIAEMKKEAARREAKLIAELAEDDGM